MRPLRFLLLALLALACDDSTGPVPGLGGTWVLAEYVDAGVVGTTTGTMTFDPNGTFAAEGTVTYPGEPEDSLTTSGSWSQKGATITLVVQGETSNWRLSGSDTEVTLQLIGPLEVTRIVLRRLTR
jgi:hypothetical protein